MQTPYSHCNFVFFDPCNLLKFFFVILLHTMGQKIPKYSENCSKIDQNPQNIYTMDSQHSRKISPVPWEWRESNHNHKSHSMLDDSIFLLYLIDRLSISHCSFSEILLVWELTP